MKTSDLGQALSRAQSGDFDKVTGSGGSVERSNNTVRAYVEIRRRILSGEMIAGAQFLEQELAELLGMSRTPVREALIRLAEDHLVEVRPRHGVKILPITADDVRQCYELLVEIEIFAVRRIAEAGLRNEDHAAMSQAIAAMETALDAGHTNAWAAADRAFHDCLYRATGNGRLADIAMNLADQTQQARMMFIAAQGADRRIGPGHAQLLETLRQQQPEEAVALKRAQITASSRRINDFFHAREASR